MSTIESWLQQNITLNRAFRSVEENVREIDLKIEEIVSPCFTSDSTTSKQICLNLCRTAPFFLISHSLCLQGLYGIAGTYALYVHSNHFKKRNVELTMKVLQGIGTAFFIDALCKSSALFKMGNLTPSHLSIPLDLIYSAAYFYLCSKQERRVRKAIRKNLCSFAQSPWNAKLGSCREAQIDRK